MCFAGVARYGIPLAPCGASTHFHTLEGLDYIQLSSFKGFPLRACFPAVFPRPVPPPYRAILVSPPASFPPLRLDKSTTSGAGVFRGFVNSLFGVVGFGFVLASKCCLWAVVRYPPKGATCRPPLFYRLPFAAALPVGVVGWGLACSEALGAFAPPALLPLLRGGGLLFGYHLKYAIRRGGGCKFPHPNVSIFNFQGTPTL